MKVNRAGKQTKAYWRSSAKKQAEWEKATLVLESEKAFGIHAITQQRLQGFAAGWVAGVRWAKQDAKKKAQKK